MNDKTKLLEDIERLRGFACILVLIQHIAFICPLYYLREILHYRLLFGEGGVYIFFAISGFVVTLSLKEKIAKISGDSFLEKINSVKSIICSFYKRRLFRIVPVMIFAVLLTGAYLYISEPDFYWLRSWLRAVPELFFGVFHCSEELYQFTDKLHNGGMGPLWTIAIETQFYMLWPIVLLMCKNNNARAITALSLGCLFLFVIQPAIAGLIGTKYYATYSNLPSLLLGSFFAFLYTDDIGKNINKTSAKFITLALAMTIWYYPSSIEKTYFYRIPLHLAATILVVFCAFVKDSFNFPFIGRILKFIGSRSYSFYAIQLPIANLIVLFTNSIYFPKESFSEYEFYLYQFIIYLVVFLAATELVYRFIEKPLRRKGYK